MGALKIEPLWGRFTDAEYPGMWTAPGVRNNARSWRLFAAITGQELHLSGLFFSLNDLFNGMKVDLADHNWKYPKEIPNCLSIEVH